MAKRKEFIVIGLGRFGKSVVTNLLEYNQIVTALDINQELVDRIAPKVNFSACIDSTNVDALKEVGVENADAVIVAIGNDVEASILTVAILKDLGIKNIIVKAGSTRVAEILTKIGASEIINPEKESGARLASKLMHSENVIDLFSLDKNLSVVTLNIEKSKSDATLAELGLRTQFNINIIAIKRNGETLIPTSTDQIKDKDQVVVVGKDLDIDRFDNFIAEMEK